MSADEYPEFSSGDTLVIAPTGKIWKLHSSVLKANSTFFNKMFNDSTATHITKKQKFGGTTVRWRIQMRCQPDTRDLFVTFHAMEPKDKVPVTYMNVNGLGGPPPFLQLYDNLFRCIYSMDVVSDPDPLPDMLIQNISLLLAAEPIQAAQCVRRVIETHLLRAGQNFWQHVHDVPEVWADVGIRIQSPPIFREAMMHIVGAWNMGGIKKNRIRGSSTGSEILHLVMQKVKEQTEQKREIERKLMEMYPANMIHRGPPPSKRSTYATDIYLWQSLHLVRMFISQSVINDRTWRAADGGAAFYRQISKGNNAYLTQQDLQLFYADFDMTSKAKVCLENALHHVKSCFAELVAPLLVDKSQILDDDGKCRLFPYLTDTNITDEELPWYKAPVSEEDRLFGRLEKEAGEDRAVDDSNSGDSDYAGLFRRKRLRRKRSKRDDDYNDHDDDDDDDEERLSVVDIQGL